MKIIIKTKDIITGESLGDFIEEKFSTLKKFIDILKKDDAGEKTLAEVFVEVEKQTKHHRKGEIFLVKARIVLPGRSLIVEKSADDVFQAVVAAKDEMKSEIEKYKFKKIDTNRREQRKTKKDIIK
jgi:ribosomal subunit interface protein